MTRGGPTGDWTRSWTAPGGEWHLELSQAHALIPARFRLRVGPLEASGAAGLLSGLKHQLRGSNKPEVGKPCDQGMVHWSVTGTQLTMSIQLKDHSTQHSRLELRSSLADFDHAVASASALTQAIQGIISATQRRAQLLRKLCALAPVDESAAEEALGGARLWAAPGVSGTQLALIPAGAQTKPGTHSGTWDQHGPSVPWQTLHWARIDGEWLVNTTGSQFDWKPAASPLPDKVLADLDADTKRLLSIHSGARLTSVPETAKLDETERGASRLRAKLEELLNRAD